VASPSTSSDLFSLLGLQPSYEIDRTALEAAYHERSREVHPDRFASASASERVAALSKARALNDAYKTLRDARQRAEYLLARSGVTIGDNERLEPELLMEFLEQREELAAARQAGRSAEVESLQGSMMTKRKAILAKLSGLFASGNLVDAKKQLIVLRYLDRYLEECEAALED
jgi:molecular chaperone HscB